jgi:hypothetical protein
MKRYLSSGLAIIMVLAMVLVSGCGGGGGVTTTTAAVVKTTPPASSPGIPGFTAGAVGKGEPFKLVFLTQPGGAKAFEKFTIQPVVGIVDSDGNVVSNSTLPVSMGITPETAGSSTLGGIIQINAVNGRVTYTNLNIDGDGAGFILVAKSSGLQNGLSTPFNVAP